MVHRPSNSSVKGGLGAGILGAGHRMRRHEVHAGRNVRLHGLDHRLLHRTDVGDDAAGLERGRDDAGGLAAGADRRADDHQVGILAGGGEIGAAMVDQLQAVGGLGGLGPPRGGHDLLGEAAAPRGQRDRAADQADADQGDLVEHRLAFGGLAHLAATKRASDSCTAFTSASVPMVMRRCSGRP